jgi:hypothetical protein
MQTIFFLWDPVDYIDSGPMHLIRKIFGNGRFHDRPYLTIVIVVASMLCALIGTLWIGQKVSPSIGSLVFVLFMLGVPAGVDLLRKLHEYRSSILAFGSWEGGPWLAACVPLAALITLAKTSTDSSSVTC